MGDGMRGIRKAVGYAGIGAALASALGACSSDRPPSSNEASDRTITGLDQRDRTYRVTSIGPNEFELRFVPSSIVRFADTPTDRRERARAMRLIMQSKCPAGRTGEILEPNDGNVVRGRCV